MAVTGERHITFHKISKSLKLGAVTNKTFKGK